MGLVTLKITTVLKFANGLFTYFNLVIKDKNFEGHFQHFYFLRTYSTYCRTSIFHTFCNFLSLNQKFNCSLYSGDLRIPGLPGCRVRRFYWLFRMSSFHACSVLLPRLYLPFLPEGHTRILFIIKYKGLN